MNRIKVMSVFGTRPEAIKMAPLVKELEKRDEIESIVCVTAQHRQMLDQVLDTFNIKPNYDLDIMKQGQTLSEITSRVLLGLEEIIKKEKPKRILEIGTAVGYSASCFAKASNEECIIDTIELDEERAKQAIENINNIGFGSRINVIVGNVVDILPTINNSYDIIFIDANKGKYPFFLQEGIGLCRDKG
jgi:predicted O-methyltransferase YrrM